MFITNDLNGLCTHNIIATSRIKYFYQVNVKLTDTTVISTLSKMNKSYRLHEEVKDQAWQCQCSE